MGEPWNGLEWSQRHSLIRALLWGFFTGDDDLTSLYSVIREMGDSVSVAVKGLHPPAGRGNDSRNEEVKCTQRGKRVCMHVMCAHTCLHVYPWVCVYERDRQRDGGRMFSGYFIPRICNTQSQLYFCSVLVVL